MPDAITAVNSRLTARLARSSIPLASTIVKAPERNLWSSLFATDRSDFRRYSDFDGSGENARRPAYTHADVGFLTRIVGKKVGTKVPEIAKNRQKTQA